MMKYVTRAFYFATPRSSIDNGAMANAYVGCGCRAAENRDEWMAEDEVKGYLQYGSPWVVGQIKVSKDRN